MADFASVESARVEWKADELMLFVESEIKSRLLKAVSHLFNKVLDNISTPVTRSINPTTGRSIVIGRSLPGEYPRTDTGRLMGTLLWDVEQVSPGVFEGYVGTPTEHGAILELWEPLDRTYLSRTLNEELPAITNILSSPA